MSPRSSAAVLVLVLSAGADGRAGLPKVWQLGSEAGWTRGTLIGTEVDAEGRLVLAAERRTVWGPGEGIVWDLAPDGPGAFVGLSGPARLVRLGADGATATWYEGGEDTLVTAVVADGRGGAYFATAPDGVVWRASGPGSIEEVARTGASFVWALLREGDRLWAATGQPGAVMELQAGRPPVRLVETGDDPVRSLARAGGDVVAGTGTRGRILRVQTAAAAQARSFVLFDADFPEIVAVAAQADGSILALALGERRAPGPPPALAAERVVVRPEAPPEEGANPEPSTPPRPSPQPPPAPAGTATLYRFEPDGDVQELWRAQETPHALVVDGEGMLRIGTGDRGHLYRIDSQGQTRSVVRIGSDTITVLRVGPEGSLWVGAARDARVERLGRERGSRGSYQTEPIDAGWTARWGRVEWDGWLPGGARVRVRARVGNTEEPDETWTPWQEVRAEGSATSLGSFPPARRVQLELSLEAGRGGSPALRSLRVHYQPLNRAPRITKLEIQPAGIAWQRTRTQGSLAVEPLTSKDPVAQDALGAIQSVRMPAGAIRKAYEVGARTFVWEAEDPDGDPLRFRLELRREGDLEWFPVAEGLDETFYSWDTRHVPDGRYRVRLVADDGDGNPPGSGRQALRESEPFDVDHTAPRIEKLHAVLEGVRVSLEFEAVDAGGAVAAVEYAFGEEPWVPIHPLDGVADSEREVYRVGLEAPPDARTLRLRVTDRSGNVGGALETLRQTRKPP